MYKGKTTAVVIPAYNEEKLIGNVIERMPDYIDRVYVINDCSKDNTAVIVEKIIEDRRKCRALTSKSDTNHNSLKIKSESSKLSGVILEERNDEESQCGATSQLVLINHSINRGVGAAIITGYKQSLADGIDITVVMAGDNQMDPAHLPKLLDPIIDGEADYTVGDRLSSWKHMKGMSLWRRFGNFLLKWLTRIAAGNMAITDPQNGYTAISRKALEKLAEIGGQIVKNKTGNEQSSTVNAYSGLDAIYPRYGYCNDILVKLSVAKMRIKQVPIPAVYGNEKSKIRYHNYIPKVSWLLLKDFVWRMKIQLNGSIQKYL